MASHTIYIRKGNEAKWEALKPDPAKWVNAQLEAADIQPIATVGALVPAPEAT